MLEVLIVAFSILAIIAAGIFFGAKAMEHASKHMND